MNKTPEWLDEGPTNFGFEQFSDQQYSVENGEGLVKINKRNVAKNKHKKLIVINQSLKNELRKVICGNQTLGIEILLQYAVDKLKQEKKDLIY